MKTKATALTLAVLMGTSTILGTQPTVFAQETERVLKNSITESEDTLESNAVESIEGNTQKEETTPPEQEQSAEEKKEETTLVEAEEDISENSAPIIDITTDVKEQVSDNDIEQVNADDVVQIPDARLKAALNEVLHKESDSEITISQMQSIRYLKLSRRGITSLKGLEYCTNLADINLDRNQISDITPLSGLTNLADINLNRNQISDITPLSGLTNLTNIILYGNQISDITPLSGLTNLTGINLDGNQISDTTPLSGLTKLEVIGLERNQISDITPLSGLTNLGRLRLIGNQISDFSQLNKIIGKSIIIDCQNQQITQNIVIDNLNNAKVDNLLIDVDGNILKIESVGNKGTYNQLDNTISWNNIDLSDRYTYGVHIKYLFKPSISYSAEVFVNFTFKQQILNHAPTINATDKVLTVGDVFNPLDGVTAHDTEDGDITLTEANIVANNVDMNKAGTYSITYKVTDSKGASSLKTITVVVNPKMEIINHIPVINATDKVLTVGDVFNPLDGVTDSKGASSVKTVTITVNKKTTLPDSKPETKPITPNQNVSKPSSPQTGDVTHLGLFAILFGGSCLMLFGLGCKKRKNQKKGS
uniref:Pesticidal crystal protein Cry22Aa Ig-like domain-containing protein n=1 Tax=Enterococcus faecalis TaxID=1351 RepID=A0A1W6QXQ7_ENTFL|nr:leucine-rich repeat domain-containing protein [Enterococcus faecalis]ARO46178.1 hypothetical protein [Enterococcus faecalis]